MRVPRDPEFVRQKDTFGLRFCCEDCFYFHDESERCVHDFPTREHRRAFYDDPSQEWVVFCKDFDLR